MREAAVGARESASVRIAGDTAPGQFTAQAVRLQVRTNWNSCHVGLTGEGVLLVHAAPGQHYGVDDHGVRQDLLQLALISGPAQQRPCMSKTAGSETFARHRRSVWSGKGLSLTKPGQPESVPPGSCTPAGHGMERYTGTLRSVDAARVRAQSSFGRQMPARGEPGPQQSHKERRHLIHARQWL